MNLIWSWVIPLEDVGHLALNFQILKKKKKILSTQTQLTLAISGSKNVLVQPSLVLMFGTSGFKDIIASAEYDCW